MERLTLKYIQIEGRVQKTRGYSFRSVYRSKNQKENQLDRDIVGSRKQQIGLKTTSLLSSLTTRSSVTEWCCQQGFDAGQVDTDGELIAVPAGDPTGVEALGVFLDRVSPASTFTVKDEQWTSDEEEDPVRKLTVTIDGPEAHEIVFAIRHDGIYEARWMTGAAADEARLRTEEPIPVAAGDDGD